MADVATVPAAGAAAASALVSEASGLEVSLAAFRASATGPDEVA
ncbi:hypothetical protein SHKM778_73700 [Streptomyces sp. KM77-8]|uniref:Uncharacterized protein n=1 Tax=Streptomyces haneummycinicus TaxID=3074435 RepID=A0AAT9HUG8_9ACTN